MNTTPPEAPAGPPPAGPGSDQPAPPQGPRTSGSDIRDLARLRRTTGPNRKIAGVAGGLARHLDVDPLVLRVALVVLVFFGGAGLIVYGACWLLVPEDGDQSAPFNFDERTRTVALVITGVIAALALVGDTMGGYGFPWPLAVLALVVLLVVSFTDRDRRPKPTAPPVPYTGPVPGYGPDSAYTYGQTQQGWVGDSSESTAPTTPTAPATQTMPTYVAPPPTATWQPQQQSYRPRRRGPILFWFTAALAALGVGLLGIADLAGAGVADSAYPALVVGIIGVMLVVGSFYGRPGGLILVGLLATVLMIGTTASSRWDDTVVRMPASAADVQSRYEIGAGELTLDLTDVDDLDNLDGRTIDVRAGAGSIEVIVPDGVDVDVTANAGLGDVQVFGDTQDGGGVDMTGFHDGGVGVPRITLDVQVGLGEIDVNIDQNGAVR